MPKKRENELILGQYFTWKVYVRKGVFYADARSNQVNAGRHSLGTKDRTQALENVKRLDAIQAGKLGLLVPGVPVGVAANDLSLGEGRRLYLEYTARSEVTGGASKKTQQRYRAVFNKFEKFAIGRGVQSWNQITVGVAEAYGKFLADDGYAERTQYLELTTVKQAMKFFIDRGHLPQDCQIKLKLRKVTDSSAYCYTQAEVCAIVACCRQEPELSWLADVCVALACTGMRIGELATLRWDDVDLEQGTVRITNDPDNAASRLSGKRRRTKNRHDRSFPISDELRPVLEKIQRHRDGYVLHGPRGGRLKADTARNVLTRRVLSGVAKELRGKGVETHVEEGRLHSFRHYFCSQCANSGTPVQMVLTWLGHHDSKMVIYYYHLSDELARTQMKKLTFVGSASAS
ncbi:MAG: tyrosine-type recombinase/integrase [Planctomycetota bacterium]